jgi:RNA polymerase sigma factor (TIGR02999 family)
MKLLMECNDGNRSAMDLLIPLTYEELRRVAQAYLRDERSALTLQATALVHEAYLRLVAQEMPKWESRSHFLGVTAHLMRQVLVDHARRNKSAKRGSGAAKASLEEAFAFAPGRSVDLIAFDDALTTLARTDSRASQIIELRYFVGLSLEQTAEVLDISITTVRREQKFAVAWLQRELNRNQSE